MLLLTEHANDEERCQSTESNPGELNEWSDSDHLAWYVSLSRSSQLVDEETQVLGKIHPDIFHSDKNFYG